MIHRASLRARLFFSSFVKLQALIEKLRIKGENTNIFTLCMNLEKTSDCVCGYFGQKLPHAAQEGLQLAAATSI